MNRYNSDLMIEIIKKKMCNQEVEIKKATEESGFCKCGPTRT